MMNILKSAVTAALIAAFVLLTGCTFVMKCCRGPRLRAAETANLKKYEKGYRFERGGWIYCRIEGEPFERGVQHGYLLADEYSRALEAFRYMTYQTTGMPYDFFAAKAVELNKRRIPAELIEEMRGIAEGLSRAGVKTTLDDVIGWNSWMEMTESWWPLNRERYASKAPRGMTGKGRGRCSSFIATGSATRDGKIVIAHETFTDFWQTPFINVALDIVPSKGHEILMQTSPGYVASMQDFYVTGGGIVCSETTILGLSGYDVKGIPYYARIRMAMQYGDDIDGCVRILNDGNNGGIAASWLIGDIKTGEIARFEQGLLYQNLAKKQDGWFFGCNAVSDPRIRNLECAGTGYSDIRVQTGARRVRWGQLLDKHGGRIDAETAKAMLADHCDVWAERRDHPSATTICAHYDVDPRRSMSWRGAAYWNPFQPAGSIDGKVTTSDLAAGMAMQARYGRACGTPFDAEEFLARHPQWDWQADFLSSRPRRPWVVFSGKGEKSILNN